MNIDGGGGNNTLTINDRGTTSSQFYTVTGTQVTFISGRGAFATVAYSNVNQLTLNGSSGANLVQVQSTTVPTLINAGTGPEHIIVASGPPDPNRLDGIQGHLILNGPGAAGPPNDTIVINDSGQALRWNYLETPTSLSRAGMAGIDFFNFAANRLFILYAEAAPAGGGCAAIQLVTKSM